MHPLQSLPVVLYKGNMGLLCLSQPHTFEINLNSESSGKIFSIWIYNIFEILSCIRHVYSYMEGVDAHLPSYSISYLAYDLLSIIFIHSMGNNGLKGKQSGKSLWKQIKTCPPHHLFFSSLLSGIHFPFHSQDHFFTPSHVSCLCVFCLM